MKSLDFRVVFEGSKHTPGRHSAAEDDKKVSVQQPVAQPVDSWMNVMPGSVNPATAAQWQAGVRLDTAGLGICRFF